MKARIAGLIVSCLFFGTAQAGTTTISQKLDYTNNYNEFGQDSDPEIRETDPNRIVFAPPWATVDNSDPSNPYVIDHPPYFRGAFEDWGWLHDVTDRVPPDANGVESALLVIRTWDVNADAPAFEDDQIRVNNVPVGYLDGTAPYAWGTTTFALTRPEYSDILDDLWLEGQLYVFMNIDRVVDAEYGNRVTLGSSTLTVNYSVTGPGRGEVKPVFRFWSDVLSHHFYTTSESERDFVTQTWPETWTDYERIAYYLPVDENDPNAHPVYRFWSSTLNSHFYTISETERDNILNEYPTYVWELEGVVFYAYPEGDQPADAKPVHRFWSAKNGTHFYTISETEKDSIIATYPTFTWAYEGIAWYAYDK